MGRLPRNTDPSYIRLITIRTDRALLRLLPGPKVNQTIGGVIAKYQETFGMIIFAYCVLGNHIHILAQALERNLWRFEQAVNREIAKRINRHQNTRGHFWEKPYDDEMALEEQDVEEAFIYITCNPVSHGLVEHPYLWLGLNSYQHSLDGKDREYLFTDYTAYGKACRLAKNRGKRIPISDFQTKHYLKLTPIPKFAHLSASERREIIVKSVSNRVSRIKKERKAQGLGFLGRERIKLQHHHDAPQSVKRRPRPICYTKSFEAKKRFMEWFFPWLESFREASRRFRSGDFSVQFPENSIRPPTHYSMQIT